MSTQTADLKVAVVTGAHPFDVPSFHRLFRALPGIDAYVQDLENYALDWGQVRAEYDAVVFYNMHPGTPADGPVLEALSHLGETAQGIVVLHHAILAWPEYTEWTGITGLESREFQYFIGQQLEVQVADVEHPVTTGMSDFALKDETYTMAEPSMGSDVLLTTEHTPSMRSLAWTRLYRNARVFCLQLGHDQDAWGDANFQRVLGRGIEWSAGRL